MYKIVCFIALFWQLNTAEAQQNCDTILPVINRSILDFVNKNLNKQVDRGECWDLAAVPLRQLNAQWDNMYEFGREVNYKKECIYPGDIIQFEGVNTKYSLPNGGTRKESMEHHTAIIYQVISKGNYILAHQNTGFSGRKVGTSPLIIENITSGHFKIYRPYR